MLSEGLSYGLSAVRYRSISVAPARIVATSIYMREDGRACKAALCAPPRVESVVNCVGVKADDDKVDGIAGEVARVDCTADSAVANRIAVPRIDADGAIA